MFWRSVDLTGNQTSAALGRTGTWFWRSVDLTGNQTREQDNSASQLFWRSVDLTGNQTTLTLGRQAAIVPVCSTLPSGFYALESSVPEIAVDLDDPDLMLG